MTKLINDLKNNNMIIHDFYSAFESGMPIGGGLVGGLFGATKTWYCSLATEYLYFFKIKGFFSYKGINEDTIKKIAIKDIQKIIWKPKTFSGFFTIHYYENSLSGTLLLGDEYFKNFRAILQYLKINYPHIIFEGYLHKKDVTL